MFKAVKQYFLNVMLTLSGQPPVTEEPIITESEKQLNQGAFRDCARSEVEETADQPVEPVQLVQPVQLAQPEVSTATQKENTCKKGDVFFVGQSDHVKVKNLEGISNKNCRFEFNGRAVIELSGRLTVIRVDQENDRILVSYQRPEGSRESGGTGAPDGTLLLFDLESLRLHEAKYQQHCKDEARERDEIKRLMAEMSAA